MAQWHVSRRKAESDPAGEEQGSKMPPEELELLAEELAGTSDPAEVARLRERLTRGFYGS